MIRGPVDLARIDNRQLCDETFETLKEPKEFEYDLRTTNRYEYGVLSALAYECSHRDRKTCQKQLHDDLFKEAPTGKWNAQPL